VCSGLQGKAGVCVWEGGARQGVCVCVCWGGGAATSCVCGPHSSNQSSKCTPFHRQNQ
jgi:hypothetical protein